MPLIKLNNRSIKDVTSLPFGVGNLIHIQSQTASNSASISFTTGINSTYKEYQFYFINIRPATDEVDFSFQLSTDSGSNYNTTITSTSFYTGHDESDVYAYVSYDGNLDLAQSTSFQQLAHDIGNGSDECGSGVLQLFNPSSTTYVKHFISRISKYHAQNQMNDVYIAGYGNTTSAVNAVRFQFSSGNIADGTIALFGVV